jgi:ElaA protein
VDCCRGMCGAAASGVLAPDHEHTHAPGERPPIAVEWSHKPFSDLTPNELYNILQLRQDVFVVEQQCIYQDADDLDRMATHLFAVHRAMVIAYARIFRPGVRGTVAVIGRVVTARAVRGRGLGRDLMQRAIDTVDQAYGPVPIRIGAQSRLEPFYASFGFVRDGDDYLEDGIPHLPMRRAP